MDMITGIIPEIIDFWAMRGYNPNKPNSEAPLKGRGVPQKILNYKILGNSLIFGCKKHNFL